MNLLIGKKDEGERTSTKQLISVIDGKATGRIIGGNLNTIQGIFGSPYMPHIQEGDILFIEDSSKDAATIERSFSFLKINGVFDKISGIILGKHEQFDDCGTNRKPFEILLEVLQNQKNSFSSRLRLLSYTSNDYHAYRCSSRVRCNK